MKTYPGKSPVLLEFRNDSDSVIMLLPDIKVDPGAPLVPLLAKVLPEELFSIG